MTEQTHVSPEELFFSFMEKFIESYLIKLHQYVEKNPKLIKSAPGFLLNPDVIKLYLGRTHIAVEFDGPETSRELKPDLKFEVHYFDYSVNECNLMEKIIGFTFDSTRELTLPLPPYSQDLIYPTNRGADKLNELKWDFTAQSSIMGFNLPTPSLDTSFTRVVNCFFFDADETGLVTRVRSRTFFGHFVLFDPQIVL